MIERYIVAGVGAVSINRDSGAVVAVSAVIKDGATILAKLAPLIHQRAPLPSGVWQRAPVADDTKRPRRA